VTCRSRRLHPGILDCLREIIFDVLGVIRSRGFLLFLFNLLMRMLFSLLDRSFCCHRHCFILSAFRSLQPLWNLSYSMSLRTF
jgi:hypothetical protein